MVIAIAIVDIVLFLIYIYNFDKQNLITVETHRKDSNNIYINVKKYPFHITHFPICLPLPVVYLQNEVQLA